MQADDKGVELIWGVIIAIMVTLVRVFSAALPCCIQIPVLG